MSEKAIFLIVGVLIQIIILKVNNLQIHLICLRSTLSGLQWQTPARIWDRDLLNFAYKLGKIEQIRKYEENMANENLEMFECLWLTVTEEEIELAVRIYYLIASNPQNMHSFHNFQSFKKCICKLKN